MKVKKKKSVKGKIIGLSVGVAVLCALLIFLCVWFFGARYPEFDALAREEEKIGYLEDGISPQGLCTLPEESGYRFCMSGYLTDGASRLCFSGGGTQKYIELEKDGKALTTHFGGVTCSGNYLLVASGKEIVRVALADALAAENGARVAVKDSFKTGLNNAYCYYADGMLYVGEFYRKGNYATDESHHLTENGETNYAFVYVFEGDESAAGGVKDTTPEKVLSVRALVQGIAVYGDRIALSTSYGLPDSVLYIYDNVFSKEPQGSVTLDGAEIPLYRLDKTCLKSQLVMPCMSEEICVEDGRMYVLFESLSKKYRYFVRRQIDCVYSLSVGDL